MKIARLAVLKNKAVIVFRDDIERSHYTKLMPRAALRTRGARMVSQASAKCPKRIVCDSKSTAGNAASTTPMNSQWT